MGLARKIEEACPSCGDASDVWRFAKQEGTGTKYCYTCESCGAEWSEMGQD